MKWCFKKHQFWKVCQIHNNCICHFGITELYFMFLFILEISLKFSSQNLRSLKASVKLFSFQLMIKQIELKSLFYSNKKYFQFHLMFNISISPVFKWCTFV